MKIKKNGSSLMTTEGVTITMCCPHCGHIGTFRPVSTSVRLGNQNLTLGLIECPNPKCEGILFYVCDHEKEEVLWTYPGESIPYDTTDLPESITKTLEESMECYANNCFVASAMMLRKTLEQICQEQGYAKGSLYDRLKKLAQTIVLPKELVEAMDELRLLGNDAAHVEAKTFEEIGKKELTVSLSFVLEILKALYQYKGLLEELRGLKKKDNTSPISAEKPVS